MSYWSLVCQYFYQHKVVSCIRKIFLESFLIVEPMEKENVGDGGHWRTDPLSYFSRQMSWSSNEWQELRS